MGSLRTDIKTKLIHPETLGGLVDIIERDFGVGEVAAGLFWRFSLEFPIESAGSIFICTGCRTGSIRPSSGPGKEFMIFVGAGCCDCAGCVAEGGRFESHGAHPSWDAYLAWTKQTQARCGELAED